AASRPEISTTVGARVPRCSRYIRRSALIATLPEKPALVESVPELELHVAHAKAMPIRRLALRIGDVRYCSRAVSRSKAAPSAAIQRRGSVLMDLQMAASIRASRCRAGPRE